MSEVPDSNTELRKLIEQSGLTQTEALRVVNNGQAFPIALSTWKAYLASPDSKRRRRCPERVVERARQTIGRFLGPHGPENNESLKSDALVK